MEMCYSGALVMPSSYSLLSDMDMMYLEGGKTYSKTYSYSGAKNILSVNKELARVAALLGYVDAYLVTVATAGLAAMIGTVGFGALAGTMWSWADAYGNALIDLQSLNSSRKVQVKEIFNGLTLRVTVGTV